MKNVFSNKGDTLTRGKIRVEWVELGEGRSGDYNPEDPDDIELLRFDVYVRSGGEWIVPDDSSYCTQAPVSATKEQRKALLVLLMDELYDAATQWPDSSIKKLCEKLSWVSLKSLEDNAVTLGKWAI